MCIPKAPAVNEQPSPVPSMQAADNLQLGSPGVGAALLGRLALRLGSPSSGASSSVIVPGTGPVGSSNAPPAGGGQQAPAPGTSGSASQAPSSVGSRLASGNDSGLRLGFNTQIA